MAEVTLEFIGAQVQRVLDTQREHGAILQSLVTRVGELEITVARQSVGIAELSVRVDRLDARIRRIETRLGLIDAEAS